VSLGFASAHRTPLGTVRREYLDRVFFSNAVDLTRKLAAFRDYYNASRVYRSLDGTTPAPRRRVIPSSCFA
jgi:transposase InsO family protein